MAYNVQTISRQIYNAISSNRTTWLIIALFVAQCVWLAFTMLYPSPYDESYHYALIDLYTNQYGPFVSEQPDSVAALGDITRNASFLFHYLLSFPARILGYIIQGNSLIVLLRIINIAFVASGLFIFVRLFRRIGATRGVINITLLAVIMIPIFSLTAATINYDNLLFLLVAVSLLLAQDLYVKRGNMFSRLALLVLVSMSALMVKFTFLPFIAAIFGFLFYHFLSNRTTYLTTFKRHARKVSVTQKTLFALATCLLIFCGVMTYGVNIVQYQKITPRCEQVQPVSVCSQSYVWSREKRIQSEPKATSYDPVRYTLYYWLDSMSNNAVSTGANTSEGGFDAAASPIILYYAMWFYLMTGIVLFLCFAREIARKHKIGLILTVLIVYSFIVWLYLYQSYSSLGSALALQPRYLLPVIPIFLLFATWAWARLLRNHVTIGVACILIAILLLLQGGGILTYLVSSKPTWYFQVRIVKQLNYKAQRAAEQIIIGR
jgi:hypothetical protein